MQNFFIVGCPRSGTTMLQQALNRHSQIVIPPETKFFFSFVGHSYTAQRRHVERLNTDLGVRLRLPPFGVRTDDEARAFYARLAGQYVEALQKPTATRFGEKTPEHTGHLDRIRHLFPESKIVVLYRDGRDVALSLAKTPWAPGGLYANFVIWLYYQSIILGRMARPDPNIHYVRYEDIVDRPEGALGDVLAFLELPYEAAVAEGCGNRAGIPEREYAWKSGALAKITSDRVGAFQRELTDDQIAVLERLGRSTLTAFGYELLTDGARRLGPRVLLRIAFDLARFLVRVPWSSVGGELAARVRALFAPTPELADAEPVASGTVRAATE
jgi:hypothetical protein